MAEFSHNIVAIPKGKKVLDFLQELYSDNDVRFQHAWIFLHTDVTIALRRQLAEPTCKEGKLTLYLFHEVEDRHVGEITFDLGCTTNSWHFVREFRYYGDSSCVCSYSAESVSLLPTEVLFIVMEA